MACTSFDGSGIGKLKSDNASAVYKHNAREVVDGHQFKENVDSSRSHLNEYWVDSKWRCPGSMIPDYKRAVHDVMKERCAASGRKPRKLQKNAVLVRSLVVQCTPEYFFPRLKGMDPEQQHKIPFSRRGPLDQAALDAWKEAVLTLVRERFGDNLLSWQLHMDERSPHFHIQVLPITPDGRLSDSSIFSPQFYDDFNDDLGRATEHLGLERAPGGQRKPEDRISVEEWHDRQAAEAAAQLAARAAGEALATSPSYSDKEPLTRIPPECEPETPLPEKPGKMSLPGTHISYANAVEEYHEERDQAILSLINVQKRDLAAVRGYAATIRAENADLKKEHAAAMAENAALRKENDRLRRDFRAENDKLRAIPLADILLNHYGATQIERGRTCQYKVGDRKIAVSHGDRGEVFIDNHDTAFKGCGAISLVKALEGFEKNSEAIGWLKDRFGVDRVLDSLSTDNAFRSIVEKSPVPKTVFMPPRSNDHTKALRLTRERRISDDTVNHLVATGQLYVDLNNNIVAPRPHGGCYVRGTVKPKPGQTSYKRTYGGKSCGAAVLRGPQCDPQAPPRVVEGITDALAVLDRWPDSQVYIVGGNMYPDLPPLPDGQQYILMFDNDDQGRAHCDHYLQMCPDAEVLPPPPPAKDWGEAHITLTRQEIEEARQRHSHSHRPGPRSGSAPGM